MIKMTLEVKDENGKVLATLVLKQKTFSRGTRGYWAGGQIALPTENPETKEISLAPHQCSLNFVEVGSEPPSESAKT